MAYSDYGGYAYRNGERIEDRSDCTIKPGGDTFGTPGMWPGFAAVAEGLTGDALKERLNWPSGHAVLGDGPIYLVLYKQSSTMLHRGPQQLRLEDYARDPVMEEWTDSTGAIHRYLNTDHYKTTGEPLVAEIDEHRITVFYEIDDNHYQYARVDQPDGTVWTGFSGYGVGAGLEDAGYGYSTSNCEHRARELFPPVQSPTGEPT